MLSAQEIVTYLESHRQEMIDLLVKLAEVESPSTDPQSQELVINLLKEAFDVLDYKTVIVKGKKTGGYLYARPLQRPKKRPLQLMVGHCDTVWPIHTVEKMPVQAANNEVKGPGVYDMKGGLVQMLYALQVLKYFNIETPVTPIALINSDEEIGSHESTVVISRLAKIADRAFILEPSIGLSGKLKTERKGVGRYTITVKGRAAHAGLDPSKGINAIVELSYLIQELFKMNDAEKGISVNVGMVEGGVSANVVAPQSRAVIDVRVPTQKDGERLENRIFKLQSRHREVAVEVKGSFGRKPMEATPRNAQLWGVAKVAGNTLGIELESMAAGGASDGNTTSLFTATLDGLGATGDGAHAVHEFVMIDKMLERTALLTLLLTADALDYKQ
ncbi:MAG: M20 family metallopeptidase [Cyclobacteriaceae bacterium]|nr:M20 family metallopeptidase [Cyclobacteriaceae bacterium]MDH4295318.1 M20 family metallopeptidase [Cyclobacteriaceae bacterium]MDH5248263.1 M20 family metallopeptidase [Cyclobacteriaceae bacterium]